MTGCDDRERVSADPYTERAGADETGIYKSPAGHRIRTWNRLWCGDPEKNEITLKKPVVIRQGNKYGVKIKSVSPSIHMIKANIETEIAPIVGSEEQAHDLITFIKENEKNTDDGMWETNIFGKSIEQLVEDGIRTEDCSDQ